MQWLFGSYRAVDIELWGVKTEGFSKYRPTKRIFKIWRENKSAESKSDGKWKKNWRDVGW